MSRMTFLLLVSTFFVPQFSFGQAYRPKVGIEHPAFVLPNIEDGKPVSLDDFRGSKVILIHFASW